LHKIKPNSAGHDKKNKKKMIKKIAIKKMRIRLDKKNLIRFND
jgi:hypothetical protein